MTDLEIKTLEASLHMMQSPWQVERTFVTDMSSDPMCLVTCAPRVEGRPRMVIARGLPETVADLIVRMHNGQFTMFQERAIASLKNRLREAGVTAFAVSAATPECEILQDAPTDVIHQSPCEDIDQTPGSIYPFSQLEIGDKS
jgi:hypothetical protein